MDILTPDQARDKALSILTEEDKKFIEEID
jgi:hypothetical protein